MVPTHQASNCSDNEPYGRIRKIKNKNKIKMEHHDNPRVFVKGLSSITDERGQVKNTLWGEKAEHQTCILLAGMQEGAA